ncbi:hypothetical protein [Roseomonas sp. KE0001]|uniref:hypothetical protein n=1 Tax=Roseomonas sp. KE0001 TaxID=2479201 RepID=UPI0018DFA072|nr:hypothetical protein [Roseomonas sp. KE0001]
MPRRTTVPEMQTEPAVEATPAKRRPGRPSPGDTVPLTLRLPRAQLAQLAEEAGRRSMNSGRNITPQAVIMDLITDFLATKP